MKRYAEGFGDYVPDIQRLCDALYVAPGLYILTYDREEIGGKEAKAMFGEVIGEVVNRVGSTAVVNRYPRMMDVRYLDGTRSRLVVCPVNILEHTLTGRQVRGWMLYEDTFTVGERSGVTRALARAMLAPKDQRKVHMAKMSKLHRAHD